MNASVVREEERDEDGDEDKEMRERARLGGRKSREGKEEVKAGIHWLTLRTLFWRRIKGKEKQKKE